jgi:hypothetical protein
MEDKYGCDVCYKTVGELYNCDKCEAILCSDCLDSHDRREHLYPINRWRSRSRRSIGMHPRCQRRASKGTL